ncbi:unnamed protein product, partial [Iphiclides podalirius]
MLSRILFVLFYIRRCNGVIYRLNETEYNRMPALFGLDDYQPCLCKPGGVYCLARFDLNIDGQNDLHALIREYSDYQIRHFNHSYVERGICVKKSCRTYYEDNSLGSNVDLSKALGECFNRSLWRDYQLKARLSKIYYCDTHNEANEPDTYDGLFLIVIITILVLNIFGTAYEMLSERSGKQINVRLAHIFLSSFSLRQNFIWLTTPESTNVRFERLQGLHGISVFIVTTFTDNPHEFEKSYDTIHYQLIFNGLVLMQIVFVMSGFLLAYNLQVRSEKREITWKTLPKVMFLRLCRLGPANAIVLFFTMTWLRHLGSGPLWKLYVTESIVKDCRRYWWHHLTYINNYMNANSYCLVPTWHLAADTQLFIAGLLLHIATKSRGRNYVLALLLVTGMASPALHVLLQGFDALVVVNPEFYRTNRNDTFYKMHTLGHNNLAAYVIGMITGYYVYYKQKSGGDVKRSRMRCHLFGHRAVLRWLVVPAAIYVTLFGRVFYVEGFEVPLTLKLVYAATQRVVMSGITAIAIIWLVFKFNDTLCQVLEWRGWVVPSRLTFAVFLIHMDIVHVMLGQKTQLVHVSFFFLLMNHFAIVVLSFLIALPFHLTIEAPINRMIKRILDQEDATRLDAKKYN